MKRLFIVSAALLGVSIIFLLIYNFVFKKEVGGNSQTEDILTDEQVMEQSLTTAAKEEKIDLLSVEPALDAQTLGEDRIIYFDQVKKAITSITERGSNKEILISTPLGEIQRVTWSDDSSRALLTTSDNSIHPVIPETESVLTLPSTIDYAIWSNNPNQIIFKSYDQKADKRFVGISNFDGSNPRTLTEIPFRRVSLAPLQNSILVAYWPVPDSFTESQLYSVSTISPGIPKLLFQGLFGADYLFSPDSKKIAVSSVTERGGDRLTLGVMDFPGNNYQNLQIPTMVEKTVWSRDNQTLYYAQPTGIPEGSALPNDYTANKFQTRDTLWKVDVTTGKKNRIARLDELTQKIDATNLFLSPNESRLYFINKIDNLIYYLSL